MPRAVIGYPKFIPNASDMILVTRATYPKFVYPKLAPHFTFVFPQAALHETALVAYVRPIAAAQPPIPFVIRCALPVRDSFSADTYLFLVPDEGFSAVVRLHDRLYAGALAGELRLDIPFIPHITVTYTPDAVVCKQAADDQNAQPFELRGVIEALDVVAVEDDTARTVTQVGLGAG